MNIEHPPEINAIARWQWFAITAIWIATFNQRDPVPKQDHQADYNVRVKIYQMHNFATILNRNHEIEKVISNYL